MRFQVVDWRKIELVNLAFWKKEPRMVRVFQAFLLCSVLMAASQVQAAPIYYFNDPVASRAAFQAASGALTLESFEDAFAPSTSISFPIGGPQAFTVTSSGDPLDQASFSRGVTDGTFSLFVNEDRPGYTVTFTFDNPIKAFGLDVNDMSFGTMTFSDNLGNVNTDVLTNDGGGPLGGPGFENLQFFGVTNTTAFNTVQLTFVNNSASTGSIYLDRLEYASTLSGSAVVPEPSTFALLGIGGLALVGYGVRRKRQQAA
jgi:PEP-CTERM motif